jgi:hypothetical protein
MPRLGNVSASTSALDVALALTIRSAPDSLHVPIVGKGLLSHVLTPSTIGLAIAPGVS